MKPLPELKSHLKNSLAREGLSYVIKTLREALPEDAPKYNVLLQLEAE